MTDFEKEKNKEIISTFRSALGLQEHKKRDSQWSPVKGQKLSLDKMLTEVDKEIASQESQKAFWEYVAKRDQLRKTIHNDVEFRAALKELGKEPGWVNGTNSSQLRKIIPKNASPEQVIEKFNRLKADLLKIPNEKQSQKPLLRGKKGGMYYLGKLGSKIYIGKR